MIHYYFFKVFRFIRVGRQYWAIRVAWRDDAIPGRVYAPPSCCSVVVPSGSMLFDPTTTHKAKPRRYAQCVFFLLANF